MIRPALPLLAAALFALCGCRGYPGHGGREDREDTDPTIVRVYTVAPEKVEEIRNALANVLAGAKDDAGHGRASVLPDGRLLVLAPLRMQASIAEALKQIDVAGADRGPGPSTAVRMHFWLVDADAGAGADDAALKPLAEVLMAVKESVGAQRFVLHDAVVSTANLEGEFSSASTAARSKIQYRLRPAREGVRAELHFEGDAGSAFNTSTTIPFDQTVVLAQLNAAPADNAPGKPHARLYVVRAERATKP